MPKQETFESDHDGSKIEPSDLVVVSIHRVGQGEDPKTMYVSEDQLADLLEEAESLSAMFLSD